MFIIIGIVLLFSVGAFLYMRQASIERGGFFAPKTAPVEKFIDLCTKRVAQAGITLIGQQGGYLELPEELRFNPTLYVSLFPNAPARFVDAIPKIPFWYYYGRSRFPTIEFIKRNVAQYIEDNIHDCLRNFSQFRDEFIINEHSAIQATAILQRKDVVIQLDYDIDIQKRGTEDYTRIERFIVSVPVKLEQTYNLAVAILEQENLNNWFENITLDLMALHPDDQIPFSGTEFDCADKFWFVQDIKEKVQEVVSLSLPAVRFRGTDHAPFLVDNEKEYEKWADVSFEDALRGKYPKGTPPPDVYEYFQYYLDPATGDEFDTISAAVKYDPLWGMDFVATPSQGGLMRTQSQGIQSQLLSFICLKMWHFVYDVRYPVAIMVRDPNAFGKDGFIFQYAIPVQIFHNRADRSTLPVIFKEQETFVTSICDKLANVETRIRIDNAMWEEVGGIKDVNITYDCFDFSCYLGKTAANKGEYSWVGPLPANCNRGFVRAEKPGYLTKTEQMPKPRNLRMELYPLKKLKLEVYKHRDQSVVQGISFGRKLEANEFAIVTLNTYADQPVQFDTFVRFDSSDYDNPNVTIELLHGAATYDVNAMIIRQVGDEGIISGGWIGNWTPNVNELTNSEKLEFHLVGKFPPPTTSAGQIEIMQFIINRTKYEDVNPVFVPLSGSEVEEAS